MLPGSCADGALRSEPIHRRLPFDDNELPEFSIMTNQFDFSKPFNDTLSKQKRTQFHCQWQFSNAKNYHIAMLFTINNAKINYVLQNQIIEFTKGKIRIDLKTGTLLP